MFDNSSQLLNKIRAESLQFEQVALHVVSGLTIKFFNVFEHFIDCKDTVLFDAKGKNKLIMEIIEKIFRKNLKKDCLFVKLIFRNW